MKTCLTSTKQSTGIRETPGIITVITEEEIQQSGARDIIDLFQLLVPGFGFGVDVEGVVGIGVRGLWAHEGKVLFMVDDQEINEGMFGTVQLGNHFSLENINRIEIIRGPGSAVYGGFASVALAKETERVVMPATLSHQQVNQCFITTCRLVLTLTRMS